MSEIMRNRGGYLGPRTNRRLLRDLAFWSCLFLAFARGGLCANRVDGLQHAPSALAGPGLEFAIADFDGDHRPDLATLQTCRDCSAAGSYWIQLQLSAAGPQSIHVFGPPGGLVVEARDVNGDHAVDLVLFTAWSRQPVAVLLNNGHGSFSRAEPGAFLGAFRQFDKSWGSISSRLAENVGVPPKSQDGSSSEAVELPYVRSLTGPIPASTLGLVVSTSELSYAGRAPPFEVFHA